MIRREQNVRDSFRVQEDYKEITNQNVLVLADVITTGATLEEVGKTLHAINPTNKLYFFTLASAGREQTVNAASIEMKYFNSLS